MIMEVDMCRREFAIVQHSWGNWAPELQQAPCLSTTPVAQHSGELAFRGPDSEEPVSSPAQAPREMEQVWPAKPGRHAHAAVLALQVPPLRQAASLVQLGSPHMRAASGASPSARVHSCSH